MVQEQEAYKGAPGGRATDGVSPEALPLFVQPWWLDAVCSHWQSVSLESEGQQEAVWNFQLEKKWGLRLLRNPLLCPYTGPVFAKGMLPTEDKAEALFRLLPRLDYLQFSTPPEMAMESFFRKKGMHTEARRTFYIDLREDEAVLFNAIQARRRNYIRSAARQLLVETCIDPDLELFVRWHRKAFEKKGKAYPYSFRVIRKVFEQGLANGNTPFLVARKPDGKVLAMLWTPVDGEKAYHLLAAIEPEAKVNGAMDLLTWEAIRSAKASCLKWYDFEGSMEEGIARFFRNFGGMEKSFTIYEKTPSRIWRLKKAWLG